MQAASSAVSAFETDFWKDAKLRKVWDEIVPGQPRKTLPYKLTHEAIALYCKAVLSGRPIRSTWMKSPPSPAPTAVSSHRLRSTSC
jgi:hypothetical protein